ncbi:serine hydrolase domain-containing protein [Anianabacter salinae]|uniref:serine hydrolase domain-containing protein n=1 Tax=Anianabacter salinae TaxID=2851023 RepID=UPI00225E56D8|nr:serine hydrolase [Anianabacter salinae]MBV0912717.1 beta-lactamase family protein [Anianabacter salinae]
MTTPTRRMILAGLGASLAAPALRAQGTPDLSAAFTRAGEMEQLWSLAVAQGGEVLKAQAFRGPALDVPVNIKSVSKSIISALVGISIGHGEVSGVDQPIAPILARWVPRRADPRVRAITVGDLLTMRSGLTRLSGAAYGDWVEGTHWIYDALSEPMVAEPGTDMLYSTASYHMLGAVLMEATGQNLLSLARDRLGVPLGIEIPAWTQDPSGRYLGGNDMRLSPEALMKLGETYRQGGFWGGTQVIPTDWITQSWTPRTRSPESGHEYGYGWYAFQPTGWDTRYARGYGGQMIWVVPDLRLTVVATSDASRPAGESEGHFGALNALLAEAVLPVFAP